MKRNQGNHNTSYSSTFTHNWFNIIVSVIFLILCREIRGFPSETGFHIPYIITGLIVFSLWLYLVIKGVSYFSKLTILALFFLTVSTVLAVFPGIFMVTGKNSRNGEPGSSTEKTYSFIQREISQKLQDMDMTISKTRERILRILPSSSKEEFMLFPYEPAKDSIYQLFKKVSIDSGVSGIMLSDSSGKPVVYHGFFPKQVIDSSRFKKPFTTSFQWLKTYSKTHLIGSLPMEPGHENNDLGVLYIVDTIRIHPPFPGKSTFLENLSIQTMEKFGMEPLFEPVNLEQPGGNNVQGNTRLPVTNLGTSRIIRGLDGTPVVKVVLAKSSSIVSPSIIPFNNVLTVTLFLLVSWGLLFLGMLIPIVSRYLYSIKSEQCFKSGIMGSLLITTFWVFNFLYTQLELDHYFRSNPLFNPEYFGATFFQVLYFQNPMDFVIKSVFIFATMLVVFRFFMLVKKRLLLPQSGRLKLRRIWYFAISILFIVFIILAILILQDLANNICSNSIITLIPSPGKTRSFSLTKLAIFLGMDCLVTTFIILVLLFTIYGVDFLPGFNKKILRFTVIQFILMAGLSAVNKLAGVISIPLIMAVSIVIPFLYFSYNKLGEGKKLDNLFSFTVWVLAIYLVIQSFGYPFLLEASKSNRAEKISAAVKDSLNKERIMEIRISDILRRVSQENRLPKNEDEYFNWLINVWRDSQLLEYTPFYSIEIYDIKGNFIEGFSMDPWLKRLVNPRIFKDKPFFEVPIKIERFRSNHSLEKFKIQVVSMKNLDEQPAGYLVITSETIFPYSLFSPRKPFQLLFKFHSPAEKILEEAFVAGYQEGKIVATNSPVYIPPLSDMEQLNQLEEKGELWVTNPELRRDVYFKVYPRTMGEEPDLLSFAFIYPGTGWIVQSMANLYYSRLPFIIVLVLIYACIFASKQRIFTRVGQHGISRILGMNTFRNKLVMGFLTVTFIPFFILYPNLENLIISGLLREQGERSKESVLYIKNQLENKAIEIFQLFDQDNLRGIKKRNNMLLRQLAEKYPGINIIDLVIRNESGKIVYQRMKPDSAYSSIGLEHQVYKVFHDGIPYTTYKNSSNNNRLYLVTIIPWRNLFPSNTINGTIMGVLEINSQFIRMLSLDLNRDINVYLDDEIVASSIMDLIKVGVLSTQLPGEIHVSKPFSSSQPYTMKESFGILEYYNSYYPLKNRTGETVGFLSSPSMFEANRIQELITYIHEIILIVSFAMFLVSLFIAMILSFRMTAPLNILMNATHQLSEGKLGHQVQYQPGEEFSYLVDAFNRMSMKLKSQHEKLVNGKQMLESILYNVSTGVLALDSKGMVKTINPAASKILGIPLKQSQNMETTGLLKDVNQELERFCRTLPETRYTTTIRFNPPGKQVPSILQVSSDPLTGYGNRNLGQLVVIDDVTDLVRSSQLETWQQAARMVAHEIKNPLTPIKLSIEHLVATYSDKNKNFEEILTNCANTIIRHVKILERVAREFAQHADLPVLKMELLDINQTLKESIDLFRQIMKPTMVLEENYGKIPRLKGDSAALTQVFTNIIDNALQSMKHKGELKISTQTVSCDSLLTNYVELGSRKDLNQQFVVVTISDTGPGFSQEALEKVFQPHFSTRSSGSGLGLAISRKIVLEHKGEMLVRNNEEHGAKVIVILPVTNYVQIEPNYTGELKNG